MPVWNTAPLGERQINAVNRGLSALNVDINGNPRSQAWYDMVATYFKVTPRTIKRWFTPPNTDKPFYGCIPKYALGMRPIEMWPPPVRMSNLRRRVWFAACCSYDGDNGMAKDPFEPSVTRGDPSLPREATRGPRPWEWPTGFERDPIFTGEDIDPTDREYCQFDYGLITECITQMEAIYTGNAFTGAFWELAWWRFHITEIGGDLPWRLQVFYRGRSMGEGSDAQEYETDSDGTPLMPY